MERRVIEIIITDKRLTKSDAYGIFLEGNPVVARAIAHHIDMEHIKIFLPFNSNSVRAINDQAHIRIMEYKWWIIKERNNFIKRINNFLTPLSEKMADALTFLCDVFRWASLNNEGLILVTILKHPNKKEYKKFNELLSKRLIAALKTKYWNSINEIKDCGESDILTCDLKHAWYLFAPISESCRWKLRMFNRLESGCFPTETDEFIHGKEEY